MCNNISECVELQIGGVVKFMFILNWRKCFFLLSSTNHIFSQQSHICSLVYTCALQLTDRFSMLLFQESPAADLRSQPGCISDSTSRTKLRHTLLHCQMYNKRKWKCSRLFSSKLSLAETFSFSVY